MAKYGTSSSGRDRTATEVFTPEWLVRDMCDMLEQENPEEDVFSPWHTFLEPSCGDGNFVLEILRRKFQRCTCRQDYTTALESVYGLELQEDNVSECIRRVTELARQYFKPTHAELQIINDHYIMCDSIKIMKMINRMSEDGSEMH
jgi:hypothetical protein